MPEHDGPVTRKPVLDSRGPVCPGDRAHEARASTRTSHRRAWHLYFEEWAHCAAGMTGEGRSRYRWCNMIIGARVFSRPWRWAEQTHAHGDLLFLLHN